MWVTFAHVCLSLTKVSQSGFSFHIPGTVSEKRYKTAVLRQSAEPLSHNRGRTQEFEMQINHFFLEVSEPKIHSKYNLEIQVVEETGL